MAAALYLFAFLSVALMMFLSSFLASHLDNTQAFDLFFTVGFGIAMLTVACGLATPNTPWYCTFAGFFGMLSAAAVEILHERHATDRE